MLKEWKILLLAFLQLIFFSIDGNGQLTDSPGSDGNQNSGGSGSPASVVGFAVVVSILVVAVAVVVMVCVGYGMCKSPCKRQPPANRRSDRQIRSMIPLPSPRTVQPSSANPLHVQQQNQAFSSTGQLRLVTNSNSLGRNQNGGVFSPEVQSAPPISTNVVHLGQLQSLSYHSGLHHALDTAIEQGVISTSPPQNHSGPPSMLPAPPPPPPAPQSHHPYRAPSINGGNHPSTRAAGSNSSSSLMKPRLVRPPPPYPGIGYPYQPCKPTKNTNKSNGGSVSATNVLQLQQVRELPPSVGGNSGLYARRHAKKPRYSGSERESLKGNDSTDLDTERDTEVGDNSVLSHVTDRSSPPSYSTEV